MTNSEAVAVLKRLGPVVRRHPKSCECSKCKIHRQAVDIVYADVNDEATEEAGK